MEIPLNGQRYDVAIVGGGIVGLATALAMTERYRARSILLEAEPALATHQSGHNSGVIHSGLYYRPGSLKAANCVRGREQMYRFCAENGIRHERCGKIVVATEREELPRLEQLHRRGNENGLAGLRRLDAGEIAEREPHVAGRAALLVPDTGIVDFQVVAARMAELAVEGGLAIRTKARVQRVQRESAGFRLITAGGELSTRNLLNCAGLQSDRVARMCGLRPGLRIVPFRGEYWKLKPDRRELVRDLIYPVPDPRFPFLGVHFTRGIDGEIEAGPNAVLALAREGYERTSFSLRDCLGTAAYPGFWRLGARLWRTGAVEMRRSWSRRRFVAALRRLVPELCEEDVEPHGAGVRAQAVSPGGELVDDFRILEGERMLHVLNAPSPAATASLSIGAHLAERAGVLFGL